MTLNERPRAGLVEARSVSALVDEFAADPVIWERAPSKRARRLLLGLLGTDTAALWFAPCPADADLDDLSARTAAFPRTGKSLVPDEQVPTLRRAVRTLAPLVEALVAELGNAKSMEAQLLAVTAADPDDAREFARDKARDQRITFAGPVMAALLDAHPVQRAALLADRRAIPLDLVRLADERVRELVVQRYARTQDTVAVIEALPDSQLQGLIDDVGRHGTYQPPMSPRLLKDLAVAELQREDAQRNRGWPGDLIEFLRRLLQLQVRPQQYATDVRPLREWLALEGGDRVVAMARRVRQGESDAFYSDHWELVQGSAERLLRRVHLTLASTTMQEFRSWLDVAARTKAQGMPNQVTDSIDGPWRPADWSDSVTADVLGMNLADGGPSLFAAEQPAAQAHTDDGSGEPADSELVAVQRLLKVIGDLVPEVMGSHPKILTPGEADRLRSWLLENAAAEMVASDPEDAVLERLALLAHRMLNEGLPKPKVGIERIKRFLEAAFGALAYADIKAAMLE